MSIKSELIRFESYIIKWPAIHLVVIAAMSAAMETDEQAMQFNSIDLRFYTVLFSFTALAVHANQTHHHIDAISTESPTSFERQTHKPRRFRKR